MTSPQPQPSASSRTNRRSYFQEGPMEEYTPAPSLREQRRQSLPSSSSPQPRSLPLSSSVALVSRPWREFLHFEFWADGRGRPVLRVLNAAAHLVVCSVLLAIVVEFMVRYRGQSRR